VYLRVTQRRNKGGDVVRYLQLAHNVRNERGVPVAKVIHTFGREDEVDREALVRLVGSISRFLEPEQALAAGAPAGFDFIEARELGRPHVVASLWSELGIGRALGRAAGPRRFRREIERHVFALVAQRTIAPASKLEATRWAPREVVLPGVGELTEDALYSAMDFLLACSERVQEAVFFSVANLLNSEVDVVFFDTTSTYFETETEDDADGDGLAGEDNPDQQPATDAPLLEAGLRRLGHSKDHRPDRPQVIIGLAVNREGIPVRVWVWPGNTNDQTVIESVKNDLGGWKLGRLVWVVDSGFSSSDNLRYLQRAGGHYIAGMKLRSGTKEAALALKRQGRYQTIADNMTVKQVIVGDGANRQRFIVARNPREAERDQARRERTIARLTQELADLDQARGAAHEKAACALRAHPSMGRYIRQNTTGRLIVDRSKIQAEQHLDGKYLLTCSDDTLSPEDIALGYKNLLEAERGFKDLKGTLLMRPVFHRKEDRIRAHVLVCFLALVIVRVAELRTGQTWRTIGDQLQPIKLGRFRSPDGEFSQRTELTTDQQHLLHTLGVPEPPRFADITPHPPPTPP
jgi:hypothetical protein